jgi:dTDP-4-amino-4,6-dideoxygalactose transaminase
MYYILLPDVIVRDRTARRLKEEGIHAIFHYLPLHSSTAGLRFGRPHGLLTTTEGISDRVLRLPMWMGLSESEVTFVVETLTKILTE